MVEAGIGAGFWLSGAAHQGAHANAGEFGHAVIDLTGPRCVCGRVGCLEAVHGAAIAAGDLAAAARALAVGAVNLVQTLDVTRVVLVGADLLTHEGIYLAAARQALATDLPADDWRDITVEVSSLRYEAVAAGAAMHVLQTNSEAPS
jgi:predicted NBD/HSP70 family sugar kinase